MPEEFKVWVPEAATRQILQTRVAEPRPHLPSSKQSPTYKLVLTTEWTSLFRTLMEPLYSTLPPGGIRLVKWLHIDKEDQLRCSLVTANLDSSIYIALSYTWSHPENSLWAISGRNNHALQLERKLVVNDQHIVMVGGNLYSALTSAHISGYFEGEGRRDNALWIDKICVNQSNTEDRNTQINQMDTIYTKARWVSIWFGEEDSSTPRVTDMIKRISESAFVEGAKERRYREYPSVHETLQDDPSAATELQRLGLEDVTMEDWSLLIAFYQRRWFTRVWTVQESALSTGNWCLWGSYKFDWPSICKTAEFLVERSIGLEVRIELGKRPGHAPMNFQVLATAQAGLLASEDGKDLRFDNWLALWHHAGAESMNGPLVLDFLLQTTSIHCAEDDRDRIFGLLGIVKQICGQLRLDLPKIAADYTRTTARVFRSTTTTILLGSGSLGTLVRRMCPRAQKLAGLPSWVCDYTATAETESFLSWQDSEGVSPRQPPFSASASTKLGFSIQGKRLQTNCWRYSTVVSVGQRYLEEQGEILFEHDASLVLAKMEQGATAGESIRGLCQVFEALFLALYGTEMPNVEIQLYNYTLAYCCNLRLDAYSNDIPFAETLAAKAPQLKHVLCSDTQGWMPTLAAIEEHFEKFVHRHPDSKDRKAAASTVVVEGGSAFPTTVSVLQDKRRLFLLAQGQFGIGHQDIEVGDRICIVPDGLRMSVILREAEGRHGDCQLIGEAFVDGIMYGEALGLMGERGETWEKVWIV
ncbi:hypothetical protein PRZ48_014755 [Zasmidium cellare]|uniref:Heterokaryon incompatibility domain-containing protein n=1 Tax=Zasmidium cellare TaxID=395010 RepID=A0ABR0DZ59_ZASCE|nr:hypothetical protein PRZ48_014755 [Zasmidium cellare]